MPETPPNWRLILQAARALTAAGQTPFIGIGIYEMDLATLSPGRPRPARPRPHLPGHDKERSAARPAQAEYRSSAPAEASTCSPKPLSGPWQRRR